MSRIHAQDRVLFTVTEFDLIQSSLPSTVKTLSRARVKSQIARARRYWDKYRDLAHEQHRAKKESGKGVAEPGANVRTERKAQILAETLSRFEKRMVQIEQQERRKKTLPGKSPPIGARQPARPQKTIRRKKPQLQSANESAVETRAARQLQKSRKRAIQGHIRARGKRRQAKRDSR